jgi:hypothetical protein
MINTTMFAIETETNYSIITTQLTINNKWISGISVLKIIFAVVALFVQNNRLPKTALTLFHSGVFFELSESNVSLASNR